LVYYDLSTGGLLGGKYYFLVFGFLIIVTGELMIGAYLRHLFFKVTGIGI